MTSSVFDREHERKCWEQEIMERQQAEKAHSARVMAAVLNAKTEPRPLPEVTETMKDEAEETDAGSDDPVTRMSISLPVSLKAEMDASKGANWSKIAREAFKAKLLEFKATQKGTTMEDAIKRLKAAAALEGEDSQRVGKLAGEEWAKDSAKPSQLKRLTKAVEQSDGNGNGTPDYFVGVMLNRYGKGPWVEVACAILGNEDADTEMIKGFWEVALGDDSFELVEDENFAIGFVTGALDVWGQVQGHI